MTLPRGYLAGTTIALALAWLPYGLSADGDLVAPIVQTVIYVGLAVLTARSRRLKILVVRTLQRWVINPVVRALFAVGLNPLGLVILETRGRVSGRPRRTPVGNGRIGDSLWIIAEHGSTANYVRNIDHDPRVRVRIRQGLRYQWVVGVATVLPDDDPLARQRRIARWHPLRAFNAMNVRLLGADLLTVRIDLDGAPPDSAVWGDQNNRALGGDHARKRAGPDRRRRPNPLRPAMRVTRAALASDLRRQRWHACVGAPGGRAPGV